MAELYPTHIPVNGNIGPFCPVSSQSVCHRETCSHCYCMNKIEDKIEDKKWLTVSDICSELGVARATLSKWRRSNAGPTFKKLPNGQLRISRIELDSWVNQLAEVA